MLVYSKKKIKTRHNKRFAVMRGVCPQKVLSDFQMFFELYISVQSNILLSGKTIIRKNIGLD
ncbi:hypothetical protein LJC16_02315, partial [Bacteroidales bacterium OttesenSCG-928-C19]|nr:hypothetical protein [Bacteroidales bacterium OttesenSCG-928-C19]